MQGAELVLQLIAGNQLRGWGTISDREERAAEKRAEIKRNMRAFGEGVCLLKRINKYKYK
jgi:hypothetical protein